MGQDDRQGHIPNWLRQLRGWEETPDWLLRFIEQSEGSLSFDDLGGAFGAEAFGGSADETAMDDELAQAGEWFDRLSEGKPEPQQSEEPAPTPTVSEPGEDWFSEMTEVFDTSLEAPAGDASLDWLDQLQPSQDEALPSVGAPEETGSLFDAAPEGISGEEPPGDLAGSEVPQEAVPDWLAGLDQGFPEDEGDEEPLLWADAEETSEADDEAPIEEEEDEATETGGLPDWLVGESESEPEMPDWMAGLGEGEATGGSTADWLAQIEAGEQELTPEEPAAVEPAPAEPVPDVTSVPETADWLTGLAEGAPLAEEPAGETLEGGTADWLSEIVTDEEPTLIEATPEADSVAETADWLTGLAEGAPLAEEPAGEVLEGGTADWLAGIVPEEEAVPAAAEPTPEPASVAETPDWLTGLGEESPLSEEVSEELVDEGVPDWLSETVLAEPVEAVPEQVSEAIDEIPDWLAEPEAGAAEEPVQEIDAEEEAPAWLLEMSEDETEAGALADVLVPEEAPPAAGEAAPVEAPDWLARLSVEVPPEEVEAAALAAGVPDWLSVLEAPAPDAAPAVGFVQPTPDWLSALEGKGAEEPPSEFAPAEMIEAPVPVAPEAPVPAVEPEAPEPEIEPGMFDEGAPDWLVDVGEVPALDAAASADDEDGVPSWLSDLDMAAEEHVGGAFDEVAPAELEEPVSFVPDAAGQATELPGWLANVDQHVPVETESPVLAEAPLELPEEPAPAAEQEEEAPDWLDDMGDVVSSRMPQERKGVTAWLQDIQEMPVPEETVSEQEGEDVEMPSWLQDMDLGITDSAEASGAVSESLEDMPDWLREMPQEDVFGVPGAAQEAAPTTLGESSMQGAPSWMQEVYEVSPTLTPTPDALELSVHKDAAEESPEWLDALREQDQEPKEDELPVETSGPLAGLRGVLNPEPLLAILPRATYKPIPPVEEAERTEAQRVAELLAQPVRRTTISTRSPGRAILASLGRWLIYIALVAFMLISPLQPWVRPPVRSEAQGFYYAIDALQPGSEVLLVVDYDTSLDGELTPQLRAIVWHLLHRNLGVVFLSLDAQGPAIARDILAEIPSAISGEHYLDLGYLPAQPASLRGFVDNPIAGAKTLVTGDVAPADTTLGQRIVSFDDLDLIITITGDHEHVRWWIEQVGTQSRVDLLAAVSTSAVPYLMPYYDTRGTGQLAGILSGLSGAVQYEQLAEGQVAPNAWPNYVVLVNAQMLLVGIVLVAGVSSMVSGIVQRARRSK